MFASDIKEKFLDITFIDSNELLRVVHERHDFLFRPLVEGTRIRGEGGKERKRASGASNGGTAKRLKGKADRGRTVAFRRALVSF